MMTCMHRALWRTFISSSFCSALRPGQILSFDILSTLHYFASYQTFITFFNTCSFWVSHIFCLYMFCWASPYCRSPTWNQCCWPWLHPVVSYGPGKSRWNGPGKRRGVEILRSRWKPCQDLAELFQFWMDFWKWFSQVSKSKGIYLF